MRDFLAECGGYAVVDGGFATELERHGQDLNDPLWSAKCLISSPQLVRRVHLDYLEAGLTTEEAETLIKRSVEIACEARQIYLQRCAKGCWDFLDAGKTTQRPVLVAASVGSYGAYLADGSEYSGNYGDSVTLETLKDFHRRRVQILANSGADLIAFETIPNKLEAQAYAELLKEENINIPAWFSFTSKDGINAVSGNSIADLIAFETIPNKLEAQAYAELLKEENINIPAWFSFTSKDGINAVSGNSIADLIAFETIPNKLEAQAYAELLKEENINIPAWFSFTSKDGINAVHLDYLEAGANVIISASYQATVQASGSSCCFCRQLWAYLADGSEYRNQKGKQERTLYRMWGNGEMKGHLSLEVAAGLHQTPLEAYQGFCLTKLHLKTKFRY
ncbi:Homocysteine S-methyltransferase 2 [Hibiscus syriacus]|uniref:Homocysteine S-methyltransferase 2 n=1 Tax=Hibiscus syriacus TaxID=106335 RepID=A0A6A3AJE4_HIBSY|nr:Homocysteine S-methyltransferase 2 [Hibiscus syriacus]